MNAADDVQAFIKSVGHYLALANLFHIHTASLSQNEFEEEPGARDAALSELRRQNDARPANHARTAEADMQAEARKRARTPRGSRALLDLQSEKCGERNKIVRLAESLRKTLPSNLAYAVSRVANAANGGGGPPAVAKIWPRVKARLQVYAARGGKTKSKKSRGRNAPTKTALALGVLAENPGWTTTKIAELVDVRRDTLEKNERFKAARAAQKTEGGPRGFRNARTGNLDVADSE